MALEKKLINGQKAYQRGNDTEDRSLAYRNWIRTVNADGFFIDIDFLKLRNENGKIVPRAITELTRCDSETVSQPYLDAIIDRYFKRDKQGETIQGISELLDVPAYLVLFQKDMKWIWAYSFKKKAWKEFTLESWEAFLKTL